VARPRNLAKSVRIGQQYRDESGTIYTVKGFEKDSVRMCQRLQCWPLWWHVSAFDEKGVSLVAK